MTAPRWPYANEPDPRPDHHYAAACWLLGRHAQLDQLARRIPGLVTVEEDGDLHIDREVLASVVNSSDQLTAAWEHYKRSNPEPFHGTDAAYERWEAAGPTLGDVLLAARARAYADDDVATAAQVHEYRVMSSGEQARLRILATLGSDRVGITLGDLAPLDPDGRRLVDDWCRVVQTA